MSSLVTIEKIEKIEPLDGSRNLEVLYLAEHGWRSIAQKGKFFPGGLCVFAVAGTYFPYLKSETQQELEFIRDTFDSRIKTLKIRGQISDGYALTLDVLPKKDFSIFVGRDVTDILNAVAWEPNPNINHTLSKGPIPPWLSPLIQKERVLQSNIRLLRTLAGTEFYGAEKFDGMSAIFYYTTGMGGRDTFGVCSRNLEFDLSKDHPLVLWGKKNNIRDKMKVICQKSGLFDRDGPYPSIYLQGEFVSPLHNRNYYRIQDEDCYFHTLGSYPFKDNILNRPMLEELLSQSRLKVSPIVERSLYLTDRTIMSSLRTLIRRLPKIGNKVLAPRINVQELVGMATFKSSLNPKVEARGLTIKPSVGLKNFLSNEKDKIFTIQNPEFNLRNNQ